MTMSSIVRAIGASLAILGVANGPANTSAAQGTAVIDQPNAGPMWLAASDDWEARV
jgi:hypothetical protein